MFIDTYLDYLQEDDLDEGKVNVAYQATKGVLQKGAGKASSALGWKQAAQAAKRKKMIMAAAKKRGQSSIAAMKGAKALQRKAMIKAAAKTTAATAAVGGAGYAATR